MLVSVTAGNHRDLGYCVTADWISHAPIADGMQIAFRDGSTSNVRFIEDFLALNQSNAQEMVLFQGSVYRNEFPDSAKGTTVHDVERVALLSGGRVCSNRVAVEHGRKRPTEPTDEREPE
jgi:hypothetical protein